MHTNTQKKVSTHQDLHFQASKCSKLGYPGLGLRKSGSQTLINWMTLKKLPPTTTTTKHTKQNPEFQNKEFSKSLPEKIMSDCLWMLYVPYLNKLKQLTNKFFLQVIFITTFHLVSYTAIKIAFKNNNVSRNKFNQRAKRPLLRKL